MRTFIAIDLPKEVKNSLLVIQEKLKASAADVGWIAPENIHLTLKFLGERNEKKIQKFKEILIEVANNQNSYQIHINSLGAFPTNNSPRVIWVGIEQGDQETKSLALKLEEKIAKAGVAKEDRPFSSHITIGRTRSPLHREQLIQELNNLPAGIAQKLLVFPVKKITLFKSTLGPKGPTYEILQEASLKTA